MWLLTATRNGSPKSHGITQKEIAKYLSQNPRKITEENTQ